MTRLCMVVPAVLLIVGCSHSVATSERAQNEQPSANGMHSVSFAERKGLKLGMTREEVLSQLKGAIPRDKVTEGQRAAGCIIRPSDSELASDTWIVTWVSHFAVGSVDAAELHFAEGRLVRVEAVVMAR